MRHLHGRQCIGDADQIRMTQKKPLILEFRQIEQRTCIIIKKYFYQQLLRLCRPHILYLNTDFSFFDSQSLQSKRKAHKLNEQTQFLFIINKNLVLFHTN